MKKIFTIMLILILSICIFTGCGGSDDSDNGETTNAVKTGLGVVTSVGNSVEPKESDNGTAQTDSVAVAVTVDSEGKIIKCKIDGTQTLIEFDDEGKILTALDTVFDSKNELGTKYGLGEASGIQKEWNEQAQAFAEYCQGKTVDEIKGISVSEDGVPTDTDLTGSVTIQVGDFISAVEKAVNTSRDVGSQPTDTLGLGVETNMSSSVNASASENGMAEANTNYVALTFGDDNKITGGFIDSVQADVEFDTSGKIIGDINADIKSKQELGDEYGMKAASSIEKEWFEQADAFVTFITGKTAEEVNGLKVNSDGVSEDTDLTASVTISITDFINLVQKAVDNKI